MRGVSQGVQVVGDALKAEQCWAKKTNQESQRSFMLLDERKGR